MEGSPRKPAVRSSPVTKPQEARPLFLISVSQDPNSRFRPYMEDGYRSIEGYLNDPSQAYFAVFDGHGGAQAMEYCRNRLHEELRKAIGECGDVEQALKRCFAKVDDQLRLTGAQNTGTTATVGLFRLEREQRVLYLANVGDTRAVLVSSTGTQRLSVDHKATNPAEINRIR